MVGVFHYVIDDAMIDYILQVRCTSKQQTCSENFRSVGTIVQDRQQNINSLLAPHSWHLAPHPLQR